MDAQVAGQRPGVVEVEDGAVEGRLGPRLGAEPAHRRRVAAEDQVELRLLDQRPRPPARLAGRPRLLPEPLDQLQSRLEPLGGDLLLDLRPAAGGLDLRGRRRRVPGERRQRQAGGDRRGDAEQATGGP